MNNTPTPRTETDLFEATKVSLEYGNQRLFKKSQSTRIVGEVAFSDGYEYALKHSSKIKQLETELAAAREEITLLKTNLKIQTNHTENAVQDRADEHIELHNQIHELREQRDRLAEAIRKHKNEFPFAPDFCDVELYEALQSLNQNE